MQVHVVSLFPEYFAGPLDCGPTRVVRQSGELAVAVVNPRDFTTDAHRTVDDYPFGGGAGMVLKPEPLAAAIDSVRRAGSRVVLLTPRGRQFTQEVAAEYGGLEHLVFVCGRYKGVDERVVARCDDELSLGDFILAGGEAAAVAVIEAVARLLPGAVEHEESVATDSFSATALLDAPWYTRPREFEGRSVPEVLLEGDHAEVTRWRREQALKITARRRPELLHDEVLSEPERELLCAEFEKETANGQES
jgi:tRNA (guanine37-N1)-methyltransferase